MRFGKENDWKSEQLYLIIRRHLATEYLKDVRRRLRKERIGLMLKIIREKEASKPSTTLLTYQALYVLYQIFLSLFPEFQTDLNCWVNKFNAVTKKQADAYTVDKRKYTIRYGQCGFMKLVLFQFLTNFVTLAAEAFLSKFTLLLLS